MRASSCRPRGCSTTRPGLRCSKICQLACLGYKGSSLTASRYWKDWTFYILTDQPWSVPAIKAITEPKHDYGVLGGQKSRFELLSLRENGVFYGVDEDAGIGRTMSVEAATENFGHAEEIRSHMVSHVGCGLAFAHTLDSCSTTM